MTFNECSSHQSLYVCSQRMSDWKPAGLSAGTLLPECQPLRKAQAPLLPQLVPTAASSQPVVSFFGNCLKDKRPQHIGKHNMKRPLPRQEVEQAEVKTKYRQWPPANKQTTTTTIIIREKKKMIPSGRIAGSLLLLLKILTSTLKKTALLSRENAHEFMFQKQAKEAGSGGDSCTSDPPRDSGWTATWYHLGFSFYSRTLCVCPVQSQLPLTLNGYLNSLKSSTTKDSIPRSHLPHFFAGYSCVLGGHVWLVLLCWTLPSP